MAFHAYWPPLAILVLFIAVVIMLILRFGARLCHLRHTAKPSNSEMLDKAYEQRVSYA
jgi:hypothetical protein